MKKPTEFFKGKKYLIIQWGLEAANIYPIPFGEGDFADKCYPQQTSEWRKQGYEPISESQAREILGDDFPTESNLEMVERTMNRNYRSYSRNPQESSESILGSIKALVADVDKYYTLDAMEDNHSIPKAVEAEVVRDFNSLSHRDFLKKWSKTLLGHPFAKNFTEDDFDEDGNCTEVCDMWLTYWFQTRDGEEIMWDFDADANGDERSLDFVGSGSSTAQGRKLMALLESHIENHETDQVEDLYKRLRTSTAITSPRYGKNPRGEVSVSVESLGWGEGTPNPNFHESSLALADIVIIDGMGNRIDIGARAGEDGSSIAVNGKTIFNVGQGKAEIRPRGV